MAAKIDSINYAVIFLTRSLATANSVIQFFLAKQGSWLIL